MSPAFYSFLHISSILILTGGTFYAFAAPESSRKRVLLITGIASLLALVAGFGLLAKLYQGHFYAWVIVKIIAWLGFSAMAGLAFRRREKAALLIAISSALLLLAVAMVTFKPGM